MRTGRTVTKELSIEARQHDLVGLDLGEGPRRRTLALGTLGFVLWLIVSIPFTGITGLIGSRPDVASLIILAPPVILIQVGFMAHDPQPRRMRVTALALRIRYIIWGSAPIIGLGSRPATREERLPLRQRLFSASASSAPSEHGEPTQAPIKRHLRWRVFGNDYMHELLTKKGRSR